MTSDVGMEDIIADNARMSLIFSEIGRLMDMPPGSLPENVQLRVDGLVQEVAELTQEYGLLQGKYQETSSIISTLTKALYRVTAERDQLITITKN
jgi:hypothetical protein